MTFTTKEGQRLDLGKYAPGYGSDIDGKWGVHLLPGQRGQLMEDLGDGALITHVQLAFSGATAIQDYNTYLDAMTKTRRGELLHPRRGRKRVVLRRVREEVRWTDRGDTTVVDLTFEESTLSDPDQFTGGPSVYAQSVQSQATAANSSASDQQTRILRRAFSYSVIALRKLMQAAQEAVTAATLGATTYAEDALLAFAQSTFNPALQVQLRGLPPLVQAAQVAMRLTGPPSEVQPTIMALERMLYATAQLNAAIQANQPVPIETEVTRAPGQSIYNFVQQWYGPRKTAPELRTLAALILRLNRNIRTPSLIPQGTIVVRPAG